MSIKRLLTSALLWFAVLSVCAQTQPADTVFFDDGSWYLGEIADSLFEGHGTMFYSDSTVYTGEWKAGLWNGQGTLTYPDGDSYTGGFVDHEFCGAGVYIYHDGAKYDGYWSGGMFNGPGTFDYADGSTYTGLWENDMKEGIGVLYDAASNTIYKGAFHNDLFIEDPEDYNERAIVTGKEKSDEELHMFDSYSHCLLGAMFSTENNMSFFADFHCGRRFYAGLSLGLNTHSGIGRGEPAEYVDEETGERVEIVGWDQYAAEIIPDMEQSYNAFMLFAECKLMGKHFGIGGDIGFGLTNTIRNCRSIGLSSFEVGDYYYRQKMTGTKFGFRLFSDIIVKQMEVNGNQLGVSVRFGYGNLDGGFIGAGICF